MYLILKNRFSKCYYFPIFLFVFIALIFPVHSEQSNSGISNDEFYNIFFEFEPTHDEIMNLKPDIEEYTILSFIISSEGMGGYCNLIILNARVIDVEFSKTYRCILILKKNRCIDFNDSQICSILKNNYYDILLSNDIKDGTIRRYIFPLDAFSFVMKKLYSVQEDKAYFIVLYRYSKGEGRNISFTNSKTDEKTPISEENRFILDQYRAVELPVSREVFKEWAARNRQLKQDYDAYQLEIIEAARRKKVSTRGTIKKWID